MRGSFNFRWHSYRWPHEVETPFVCQFGQHGDGVQLIAQDSVLVVAVMGRVVAQVNYSVTQGQHAALQGGNGPFGLQVGGHQSEVLAQGT